MSATRRTASSSREMTSRKCGVSPRSAAAKTMPQRARTAAAVSSSEGWSVVEGTADDAAELLWIGDAGRREVAGSLLRLDLDSRVGWYQSVRDRDLLHDLDALPCQRVAFQVRHRDPAVDPADAEPVEDIRHRLPLPRSGRPFRANAIPDRSPPW